MEAYPGDPYAYMPPGGSKKFHNIEGVLPLILLIVIAFFVLQFLGVVPCMIPIGCGGQASVGVIGVASPDVNRVLSSKEALMKGIKFPLSTFPPDVVTVDYLKQFKVVILQGDPAFDMNIRDAVRAYVDGGGKLIVVGDAGSRHPEYPGVSGWEWPMGQGIPVPAKLKGAWVGQTYVTYGSSVRMVDINHPIVKGLVVAGYTLPVQAEIFEVTPEGKMIAAITTPDGTTLPAVVEGGSGFGNVIYFAYDPGLTPDILLTTIRYLAGI